MFKKLREKSKNKKGFTLVELIVVIVIILVLAAVMVPSVLKYVEKANQANTKAEAATLLVQVQADAADAYLESGKYTPGEINGVSYNNVATGQFTQVTADTEYALAIDSDTGDVTAFAYRDGKYYINWTKTGGWTEPSKKAKTNP